MLYIHYVNLTHFKLNREKFCFDVEVFLTLEIVLYFVDLFNMMFTILILTRAHQFHFNFSFMQAVLFVIHIMDNVSVLIIRFLIIFEGIEDRNPSDTWLFSFAMNVTITCVFSAMCTLFFLTIERCFATLLISDYESKPRRFISVVLNFTLFSFGFTSCFIVQNKANTVFVIAFLLGINGIALMLHIFLLRWNKKIYNRLHENPNVTNYSLTRRFQISENITALRMMNNIIYYMGLMNVIVVLSVLVSSFDQPPELELIVTFFLDSSIFVYSFCYPVIMYYSCERWKFQIGLFFRRSPSVSPILSTFGVDLIQENSMKNHFEQLSTTWNVRMEEDTVEVI